MEDLVRRIAGGLVASGALLMIAAVISQHFGTRVYFANGGSANSHASATIVLVSLGLVSWLMALSLFGWLRADSIPHFLRSGSAHRSGQPEEHTD